MKDVNLGKFQSPVSPQQKRQWRWDSHQNDAHSVYFLISILLVRPHSNLELYSFEVNYVEYHNMCKTQSPVSPQQIRQWWWDLHQNDAHSVYFLISILLVRSHSNLELYTLKSTMFVQYHNMYSITCISTKETVVVRLAPKWCTFCILSDINIVGDIPYKFGAIQLWSQLCLCNITICVKTQSPVSPQQSTVVMGVSSKRCTFCILFIFRFSVTYRNLGFFYMWQKIWISIWGVITGLSCPTFIQRKFELHSPLHCGATTAQNTVLQVMFITSDRYYKR